MDRLIWPILLLSGLLFAPFAQLRAEAGSDNYAVSKTVTIYESFDDAPEDQSHAQATPAAARFGPFAVVSADKVRMNGTVDSDSPRLFARMMRSYPGIKTIEMVDCDGTVDDEANFALARMIRRAGIATVVPRGGSVRSGAVELFLAGVRNSAADDAEFVVHSWIDDTGRQARDYPANDPVHREYVQYYTEMGVPPAQAAAFYALTNSVPFEGQLTLSRADMERYQLLR